MKFLKNLKIGKKLALGFVVMILFMMVIGLNGYRSVFQIEKDIVDILEVDLAGINNLLQADRDLHQLLVAERSMIFANAKSDIFKSLVDVYDALSQDRIYRKACDEDEVMKIMSEGRGSQFDPRFYDLFVDSIEDFRRITLENP